MAAAENNTYEMRIIKLIAEHQAAEKRKCTKVAEARLNKAVEILMKAEGLTQSEARAKIFNEYFEPNIRY